MKNTIKFLILFALIGFFGLVSTTQAQIIKGKSEIGCYVNGKTLDPAINAENCKSPNVWNNTPALKNAEIPANYPTGCYDRKGEFGNESTTECKALNNLWHTTGTATKIPKEVVPDSECYPNGKPPSDDGLVQCGRKVTCEYQITGKDKDGNDIKQIIRTISKDDMCKFNNVIELINKIIQYILILAIPIVAIMFAYAGGVLLFSGGSDTAKTKAKGIFFNAVIGLVLVVGATLLIKTILTIVGYKDLGLFF